ncbi:putative ribonuclease H-like domain-containing protein [Tanacetum coccineum]
MSTQQDIYAAGSENRPPMLNKENYVPWSSRLLCYAKSRPNGKLIYNSIMNGPYVRRMIPEPGDPARTILVPETFHEQTDDELTEAKIKQMEADGQAIQTILLGLPEDIYAAVDSCKTAHEIWFTSTDGESIESYYHRFSKLMNDFKRNKHFPEKIASNLKFLNNLQPEWSRHVTIVQQTKDLHTADYTQLYDFLKYNQKEVDELRAERLAKTQDPLALMANSNNSFKYPVFHLDLPSSSTYIQQPLSNNNYNPQPSFNQNYNLEDITDPTAAMNTALALMAKAFKLNYSTPTNNNQRISSNPRNRKIAQPGNQVIQNAVQNLGARAEGNANGNNGNQIRCYNCRGLGHLARNCTVRPRRRDRASTSGTQTDKAPVYDSDGSAEVSSVEQGRGTVEQHPVTVEETRAHQESSLLNLVVEVEKVNMVNCKMRETNAKLTTELARYKNQEKCFEISQEKYDKLERCYQQFVYQEQCLTKKINALHLSSSKQITALNEELSNLNKQLSKEKSTVSSLLEEKKRLKSDFKIPKDELLAKQIHKIVKDEIFPIVNQVDARVQNFEIQFLQEAAKFVRDFQFLANEADKYLAMNKALELEIERLLRAVVSQDIMSIVQNNSFVDTLNLQTELDHTLDPLPHKLRNKNVELEFQVRNYEKEIAHLKTTYKKLFDSINVTRTQTKLIIDSLQNKLLDTIYKNAKLRAQLFDKVSNKKDTSKGTSTNTKFANQSTERKLFLQSLRNQFDVRQPNAFRSEHLNSSKTRIPQKADKTHDSNSVPTTKESKGVDYDKVIAPGMFRIDPRQTSRKDNFVPNKPSKPSVRTNPITVSQPHVIIKKAVNAESNGFSST